LKQNRDYITDSDFDGLATDEVLLNAEQKPIIFDERAIIGLFGLVRCFMDAQAPAVQFAYAATVKNVFLRSCSGERGTSVS